MKASFENSVNVLVKAYLNDTLEHRNCHACAVGNLVAAACGYQYEIDPNTFYMKTSWLGWDPHEKHWYDVLFWNGKAPKGLAQIKAVGYTITQVQLIESAFEEAYNQETQEGDDYAGLMNVVAVLAHIHNIPLEQAQEAKAMFVKP